MKIKEIKLLSNDLIGTERFYCEILGLELSERGDSTISFAAGNSTLTFLHTTRENCIYHFAFEIPHNKLNEAQKWLASRVDLIEFQGSPVIDFPNWNAKSLYFYDNNGNVLECIARFDNERGSEKPFGSSDFISISEIALVSDNVKELAADLIKRYELSHFTRQKQSEEFSVLGDDNGLIILVNSNHKWFPTPVKVGRFPVSLTIENSNGKFTIDYIR